MRQEAKSVFNFDSVGLMKVLAELNREEFYKDPITYGGALSYNRPNTHVELSRMIKKIEAGASFFLTQPVFSDEDIEKLSFFKDKMKEVNSDVKLFCGLMPLVSYKNALFIQNEMSGINVPDEVIARYKPDMSREEGEMVGVSVVRDVIAKTKDFSDGYYFSIPFNRVYLLDKILD
jgi:homocysteine S-methyltransferase